MGFPAIWRPYTLDFDGTNRITQFREVSPNLALQLFGERGSGEVVQQFTAALGGAPEITFRTPQLKRVFDVANSGDKGLVKAFTSSTVALHYRKGKNRSLLEDTDVGTAVHARFDATNNGMLSWQSVSGSAGELAEVACRFQAVSTDGETKPLQYVGSNALNAAGDPEAGVHYVLGGVKVNGAFVDSVISANLDNQLEYDSGLGPGAKYPEYAAVSSWSPRLTIQTNDVESWGDYDEEGTALTSLSLFFRKVDQNGLLVAKATAEHVKITASAGTIWTQQASGTSADSQLIIDIEEPSVGTAPITINTASAIS